MWKVHVVDLGKIFLFKICRVVKFSIQNLTRCGKIDSKSDKTKKSWFKIWQDEKFLFKIMLFTKNFYSKSCFLQNFFSKSCFINFFFSKSCFIKIFFFFKIMLFKTARKTQNLRILRPKLNQNVIFCMQFFFKIVLFKIFYSSKSCFLKKYYDSKSDALWKF